MGEIPDVNRMVSTLIRFPENNQVIEANKNFTIITETVNLSTGFFSDPVKQYYTFPQTLDRRGFIQGHSHVTVQKLIGNGVPDPKVFAFFKGLNLKAKKWPFISSCRRWFSSWKIPTLHNGFFVRSSTYLNACCCKRSTR